MREVDLPDYASDLWQPFRHLAWHGGRGPGKTRTVATGLILQSCERHERVLCGRETQRSIKDSSKRVLDDEIDRHRRNLEPGSDSTEQVAECLTGARAEGPEPGIAPGSRGSRPLGGVG